MTIFSPTSKPAKRAIPIAHNNNPMNASDFAPSLNHSTTSQGLIRLPTTLGNFQFPTTLGNFQFPTQVLLHTEHEEGSDSNHPAPHIDLRINLAVAAIRECLFRHFVLCIIVTFHTPIILHIVIKVNTFLSLSHIFALPPSRIEGGGGLVSNFLSDFLAPCS